MGTSTAGGFVIPIAVHLLYLNTDFRNNLSMSNKLDLQPAQLAEHISVGDILQSLAIVAVEVETVLLVLEGFKDGTVANLLLAFPFFHLVGLGCLEEKKIAIHYLRKYKKRGSESELKLTNQPDRM